MQGDVQISLPQTVSALLETLHASGYTAEVVGGCVRNFLLQIPVHDWDICTSATPQQVKACFPRDVLHETGIAHGTVLLVRGGEGYEITTYRTDGVYTDHRRPDHVCFSAQLEEDLARRDFTVNAMAYSPQRGLVDCFGGRDDLHRRVLRCVGDPSARFGEDALRVLRALRFCAVLEFSLDDATAQGVRAAAPLLGHVAAERKWSELTKLLTGKGAGAVLAAYGDVLAQVIPCVAPMLHLAQDSPYHNQDVWRHTCTALASVWRCTESMASAFSTIPSAHVEKNPAPTKSSDAPQQPPPKACGPEAQASRRQMPQSVQTEILFPDPVVCWALLLHDTGKPDCMTHDTSGVGHFYGHAAHSVRHAEEIMTLLRAPKAFSQEVCRLVQWHDVPLEATPTGAARRLHQMGEQTLARLLTVQRCDVMGQVPGLQAARLAHLDAFAACVRRVLEEQRAFSVSALPITGADVMRHGVPQGPAVGALLAQALCAVVDGTVPCTRAALLSWLAQQTDKACDTCKQEM